MADSFERRGNPYVAATVTCHIVCPRKKGIGKKSSLGMVWYTCTILVQLGKISAGIVEIKEVDGFTADTATWSEVPSGFFRLHIAQPLQDMIPRLPPAYWLSSGNRQQWVREHLADVPSPVGSASCHGGSLLPRALRQKSAPSLAWLHERHS